MEPGGHANGSHLSSADGIRLEKDPGLGLFVTLVDNDTRAPGSCLVELEHVVQEDQFKIFLGAEHDITPAATNSVFREANSTEAEHSIVHAANGMLRWFNELIRRFAARLVRSRSKLHVISNVLLRRVDGLARANPSATSAFSRIGSISMRSVVLPIPLSLHPTEEMQLGQDTVISYETIRR
jgi:hypothetical protein